MTAVTNIKDLVAADPAAVVACLKAGDEAVWEAVRQEVVHPFLAEDTVNGQRIRSRNVDRDDIYDRLREKMVDGRKLDALRKPEAVLSFLRDYVRAFVSALFEHKKDLFRADGTPRERRSVQLVFAERNDDADAPQDGIESFAQPAAEEPPEGEVYDSLRRNFDALWRRNPKRALVLLLRFVKRLSASEVRDFLDIVSENYVNQVVNLAKGDMRTSMVSVAGLIRQGPSDRARRPADGATAYDGSAFSLAYGASFSEDEPFYWRAEVFVEEGCGNEDEVTVRVMDGKSRPVASGTLRFGTERLTVKDGAAPCALARLRELLMRSEVALVTARWGVVPGQLKVE